MVVKSSLEAQKGIYKIDINYFCSFSIFVKVKIKIGMEFTYNGIVYKKGDKLLCSINGVKLLARINVEDVSDDGKRVIFYLCHNNHDFRGNASPDMLGMNYSWVSGISTNSSGSYVTEGALLLEKYENETETSEDLKYFLNIGYTLLDGSLSLKGFNRVQMSDTRGMVKFINTQSGRNIEIKIGRAAKRVSFLELSDNYIESLTNSYIAHQEGNLLEVKEVSGSDILKYYSTDSYDALEGNLGGSCMNNKLDYLKLYVDNPETISLLVIEKSKRVIGRALIWRLPCGGRFLDKQYTTKNWVDSIINKKRSEFVGLEELIKSKVVININIKNIDKFPYLDTLTYLNLKEGKISSNASNMTHYATNTNGTINILNN